MEIDPLIVTPMNQYRLALIHERNLSCPTKSAVICVRCAGWKNFGGKNTWNVTLGPICVCTATWIRIQQIIKKM